jgi:hypothetical protein
MAFQFGIAVPPVARTGSLLADLTAESLLTNLVLALDAGDSSSYTSGQKWLDLSGNGYDFFVGADGSVTSSDPTFVGTAGAQSVDTYWLSDGSSGDYFAYDAANETWMTNVHKDNATVSFTAWIWLDAYGGVASGICATAGVAATVGFAFNTSTTGELAFKVYNGTGTPALDIATTSLVPLRQWVFVGVGVDEAAATTKYRFRINASTITFNTAYSSPDAGAATNVMRVGGLSAVGMGTNARMHEFAAWTRQLTATEFTSLFTRSRSRFGV